MSISLLSHALEKECPELADQIAVLKRENPHFVRLLAAHDDIDEQITRDEAGTQQRLDDTSLQQLKLKRCQLKDDLYKLACNGSAGKPC
ncbi:YdcH family protein [Undibacterium sp.]|uniref:YdcH family protein n=1 Tax=Undibacterium sp. TaxID=1914977 RepID=UPI00374D6820